MTRVSVTFIVNDAPRTRDGLAQRLLCSRGDRASQIHFGVPGDHLVCLARVLSQDADLANVVVAARALMMGWV